ncbi:hypothetical protein ACEPAG_2892 [Sanghuangporus baumii]
MYARDHLDATFERFVSFFSGVPTTGAIEDGAEEYPGTDDSPPIYRSPIEQSAIRAADSLSSLRDAVTQYNDEVDSRLSYLEDSLDRMEKDFIERLDKLAESATNANDALAGSAYSLDTIRICGLMDDARIAFRFAIASYDERYKCGLSLNRENVDQWWSLFRIKVLSEEGISQSAAPISIFQLCQDKFLEPLRELKMWAEEVKRQIDSQARETSTAARSVLDLDDLTEQMARENIDVKDLRHQGVDFVAMPEKKRRAFQPVRPHKCNGGVQHVLHCHQHSRGL